MNATDPDRCSDNMINVVHPDYIHTTHSHTSIKHTFFNSYEILIQKKKGSVITHGSELRLATNKTNKQTYK